MSSRSQAGYVVAVVGATGAVGTVLLDVLHERSFPIAELRPLASERSAGSSVAFAGRALEVQVARPEAFDSTDFVFFAATGSLSKTLAPEVVARGGIVIDKSSTWRMDDTVPLVVPEVNAVALDDHRGIVACPNCTTIGFVMALEPLRRRAGLEAVVATTLQAVSGAGLPGLEELKVQQLALHDGRPAPPPQTFAAPIANNVVPLCDVLGEDDFDRALVRDFELALLDLETRAPVGIGCHAGRAGRQHADHRHQQTLHVRSFSRRDHDLRSGERGRKQRDDTDQVVVAHAGVMSRTAGLSQPRKADVDGQLAREQVAHVSAEREQLVGEIVIQPE